MTDRIIGYIIRVVVALLVVLVCSPLYADIIDNVIPYVIQVESGGRADAASYRGAKYGVGLMQISEIVLKEFIQEKPKNVLYSDFPVILTMDDMYVVKYNKIVGEWYLRRLKDHYLKDLYIRKPANAISADAMIGSTGQLCPWVTMSLKDGEYYNIKTPKEHKLALILAAYNGGITRLRKNNYNINRMSSETKQYVRKIMKLYQEAQEWNAQLVIM